MSELEFKEWNCELTNYKDIRYIGMFRENAPHFLFHLGDIKKIGVLSLSYDVPYKITPKFLLEKLYKNLPLSLNSIKTLKIRGTDFIKDNRIMWVAPEDSEDNYQYFIDGGEYCIEFKISSNGYTFEIQDTANPQDILKKFIEDL